MSDPPSDGPVRYERRGPIALVTIDHPPVNVLGRDLLDALVRRLDEAEADPKVRVVVLASASERAFAAGANIREMASMDPAEAYVHGQRGQGTTRRIERLPLPVIAAVNGVCLGGGCEIALACDFIVASDDASFGQPEINLGVMPGWGGTRRLPRRIGPAAARRWILTGRPVSANDAEAQGLVDQVVPRAELLSTALTLAGELAKKPPVALAAAKFALLRSIDPGVEEGLAYELDLWAQLFGTPDQKAGMQAFLSKQPFQTGAREDWETVSRGFPWSGEGPRRAGAGGKRKN
ncbi:MAG: enoyl-CoA hydratase/isomerase family protein [Thermoplasmata archaeon]